MIFNAFPLRLAALLALIAALMAGILLSLVEGAYHTGAGEVASVILHQLGIGDDPGLGRAREIIIWRIRLPRVLLATLCGSALGMSGAVFQGCFRNPVVEPYILGVSSGAAFGAALAIVFPAFLPPIQASAFAGALLAVTLTGLAAGKRSDAPPVSLVLAGIVVGALFTAGLGLLKYLAADTQLREITFWMMGSFHFATWRDTGLTVMVVAPCALVAASMAWKLNVLGLGDEEALSLGVRPWATRVILLLAATLAAAACVAVAGIIGWVGLMAPHAARLLFGTDNRFVLPVSAVLGGGYMLLCDTLARTLTAGEIPIGILTAVIGAPYLLWLLRSRSGRLYAP